MMTPLRGGSEWGGVRGGNRRRTRDRKHCDGPRDAAGDRAGAHCAGVTSRNRATVPVPHSFEANCEDIAREAHRSVAAVAAAVHVMDGRMGAVATDRAWQRFIAAGLDAVLLFSASALGGLSMGGEGGFDAVALDAAGMLRQLLGTRVEALRPVVGEETGPVAEEERSEAVDMDEEEGEQEARKGEPRTQVVRLALVEAPALVALAERVLAHTDAVLRGEFGLAARGAEALEQAAADAAQLARDSHLHAMPDAHCELLERAAARAVDSLRGRALRWLRQTRRQLTAADAAGVLGCGAAEAIPILVSTGFDVRKPAGGGADGEAVVTCPIPGPPTGGAGFPDDEGQLAELRRNAQALTTNLKATA